MKTHIVTYILLAIMLGSFPSTARALSAPANPSSEIIDTQYDFIAVKFQWSKSADTDVEWYHLVYQCLKNCPTSPGDALWVIQPIGAGPVSYVFVGGFDFSLPAKEARYQWRVGACSAQASGDCAYTSPEEFVTPKQPAPPVTSSSQQSGSSSSVLINPISSTTLPELLENVLNFLFGLSIVVLPIIILYGGFLMLTAGGEPEKISKSRTILLWAVVAFAIILLARGLPTVLRGIL
ncbi:MAG: pilin [bacterium]|nr:pilin [bacterium]